MKSGLLAIGIFLMLTGGQTFAQTGIDTTQSKSKKMKQFSLLVRVPVSYGPEQVKAAGIQWNQLLEKWKAEGVYVLSFPFPGESYTVSGPEKAIKKETVLSGNLKVVSNVVLLAENIEQAVELSKSIPVLPYGGQVEIRETHLNLPK